MLQSLFVINKDLEMDVRRLNQLLRDLGRQNDALMRERDDCKRMHLMLLTGVHRLITLPCVC